MRINFATYNLKPSGGVRVITEVANRLARRGHQVTITLPMRENSKPMWRVEVPVIAPSAGRYVEGSPTLDLLFRSMYSMSRKLGYKRMFEADLIKKLSDMTPDCDFNIATLFPSAFSVHRSGKGIPVYYVQCHEADFDNDPYAKKIAEESYLLPLNTIVVSTYLQTLLHTKYSRESYVCLNGVDEKVFYPREKRKRESPIKTVVCIGRSARWKGLGNIVKAMNLVHKHLAVRLDICGWDSIRIENAEFPYEIATGLTDELLAQRYSDSDLFVSASTVEGFGLPALEAMACGTPVVATNIANEDYAYNEVNSLLVSPENPEKLADAMLKILTKDDLRDSLVKEGLRTAARFNWDRTASRFEMILQDMKSIS